MPCVVMCPLGQRPPVRQFDAALGAFQRLDVRFLVNRDDQRALGRIIVAIETMRQGPSGLDPAPNRG